MHEASDIASYIIGAMPVDNLKLQKLLYYCQGVHLAKTDHVLFDDKIEAWQYGPVVPEIYNKYKNFGLNTITEITQEEIDLTEEELSTIDMTLEYYGNLSGLGLMNKTHSESPWKDAFKPNKNNEITVESMKKHFKDVIEFD